MVDLASRMAAMRTWEPVEVCGPGLEAGPVAVARHWPADVPLAALVSAGNGPLSDPGARAPRARWSMFAVPSETRVLDKGEEVAAWARGEANLGGAAAGEGTAAVREISVATLPGVSEPPMSRGWMVSVGYEVGRDLEPAARLEGLGAGERALWEGASRWPRAVLARCEAILAHDGWTGQWMVSGSGGARAELMDIARALGRSGGGVEASPRGQATLDAGFRLTDLRSETGEGAYVSAVARARELVHAGDVFQVNLAHHLLAEFEGSARGLWAGLLREARPWHGGYLEWRDPRVPGWGGAICSASPELFLQVGPAEGGGRRRITARPMKGTRPRRDGEAARIELAESEKDMAELSMIIDLMRNDLGRVARLGSVRVEEARVIEQHGGEATGVYQGVATVSAELRPAVDLSDVIGATFPPGSVTGAPKIRAMQIIEELEGRERGAYCGAMGFVGDDGRLMLNVAIRTAMIGGPLLGAGGGAGEAAGGAMGSGVAGAGAAGAFARGAVLRYPVGAGIVADSDPVKEWEETLAKAGAIRALAARIGDAARHAQERRGS